MGTAQGTTFSCDQWNCVPGLEDCRSGRKRESSSHGSKQYASPGIQNYFARMSDSEILVSTAKKSGYRKPPQFHDQESLLRALRKPNENAKGNRPDYSEGNSNWTPRDDALLDASVKTVSTSKQKPLPTIENLEHCLKSGDFQDYSSRDFWNCVSANVRSRDAIACCQRYTYLRGAGVVRFSSSPRTKAGGKSK
jgi:hypothetical protein